MKLSTIAISLLPLLTSSTTATIIRSFPNGVPGSGYGCSNMCGMYYLYIYINVVVSAVSLHCYNCDVEYLPLLQVLTHKLIFTSVLYHIEKAVQMMMQMFTTLSEPVSRHI